MIGAVEAANVHIAFTSQGYCASDAVAAQAIVDTESAWLPIAKALAASAADDVFAGKVAAGFGYVGGDSVRRVFQIDSASQANITAMTVMAQSGAWPPSMYWIAADNSHMSLATAAAMLAFGQAAGAYVSGLILVRRAIKDAIDGAPTAAALASIDVTQGWPAAG
jgi:hypothetical protein